MTSNHYFEAIHGTPTLSSEQVRQRNEEIFAYANQNPDITSVTLGAKYGLNRETVRLILDRQRRRVINRKRMAEKARQWGFNPP